MVTQYIELTLYLGNVAVHDIARVRQPGDRPQRHLFAAARDQHRWTRLLHRLRFENGVLDAEVSTVEGRPWLGPHLQDQLDCFLHLPDAGGWPRREIPTVLPVF